MGFLLGYDAGSSSVKAAILDAETGCVVAAASSPQGELEIDSPRPGWAEQDPELWWEHLKRATRLLREESGADLGYVKAVGISYQMHGLVVVGRDLKPLRPSIIWCDSRAVALGEKAFFGIGEATCRERLLNSPGNFTATRLAWVKENEPDVFRLIHKMMLPGDYLAMRMTGEVATTDSGLSEMMLWDFGEEKVADAVMEYLGISPQLLPETRPIFSVQGEITPATAEELGLAPGTPVSYRAGDQLNNAFALKVMDPGEIAVNAGTSGVVYGVEDVRRGDALSRVNVFLHVNHEAGHQRYGVLLCVNGTGILNRWLKRNLAMPGRAVDYGDMNELAASAPVGSDGLAVLPYGNGAERTLENRNPGASIHGLDFNLHTRAHLLRAAQEGIVFALVYGMEIMRDMGMEVETARAGYANMFRSPLFADAFAAATGAALEIYETDGAQGAARGAGLGAGIYGKDEEAFAGLKLLRIVEPDEKSCGAYEEAYARWRDILTGVLERTREAEDG